MGQEEGELTCRMPGVSTRTIWQPGSVTIDSSLWRVVCALAVTDDSFCPTIALLRLLLPALGRPMMATKPAQPVCQFMPVPAGVLQWCSAVITAPER